MNQSCSGTNCPGCLCHLSAPCNHCLEHLCDCGKEDCDVCGDFYGGEDASGEIQVKELTGNE